MNISILTGTIRRTPQWRTLKSGATVTTFDVGVKAELQRSEVIRVSWMDAPAAALDFNEGDEVVVVGRTRSYWSGRRSETDVLAHAVLRPRQAGKVRRELTGVMASLQQECP